mmetsp:Transcript_28477/g.83811  ORF Transcript_28477/g.83811 Transcript_28477/m.83811 type:complete len:220 (+) Transcript_28477:797-1456(+)
MGRRGILAEAAAAPPPPPALPPLFPLRILDALATAAVNFPVCASLSFTRSAYLRVLSVCSQFPMLGATHATMTDREFFPTNDSFSTCVSFDPRKGMCVIESPVASARMTSFSARRDVLISAPSIRVVREALFVSAPLSLPARSMKVRRPCSTLLGRPPPLCLVVFLRLSCKTACERLLSALADVVPVERFAAPASMASINSDALDTGCSLRPGKHTFPR